MRADEGRHVGEHARRRARLALLAVLRHAPPPAPLVEAVDGDPALREVGEEAVVAVYVVAEAVEHDHLGLDGALGLQRCVMLADDSYSLYVVMAYEECA